LIDLNIKYTGRFPSLIYINNSILFNVCLSGYENGLQEYSAEFVIWSECMKAYSSYEEKKGTFLTERNINPSYC
jgi:hypothetical protein